LEVYFLEKAPNKTKIQNKMATVVMLLW